MTLPESIKNRFNKHPEPSINGNTSLDDEFISLLGNDSELDDLIKKDIKNSGDPSSIYTQIISKLGLLESLDIKTLLTDYVSSNFWNSLGSEKQLEFIDRTLESQEEKEQKGLETIGVEKARAKSDIVAHGKPKKIDIHNLFSETVEIYHTNLIQRPELYDYIMKNWSITQKTVDLLKIGYATTSRDLNYLDETTLQKSGLVYVNDGKIGGEVFNGRIIFPYWNNGKLVYLIGRETQETPVIEREKGMKYKKLLVHNERHEYVSRCVQNSYFYGEDSLRCADYCIITEGVADCIVMLQAGFPCISPVTVQFRDTDHQKLLNLTKGLKRVYICNDNELNEAGLKSTLSTAEALEKEKIEARLIILPKSDGIDKIDIADYMKGIVRKTLRGLWVQV